MLKKISSGSVAERRRFDARFLCMICVVVFKVNIYIVLSSCLLNFRSFEVYSPPSICSRLRRSRYS